MKSILILALPILISACTLHGQQDPLQASSTKGFKPVYKRYREIDPEKAKDMWQNSVNINIKRNGPFYVEFDRAELMELLSGSDHPTVKMLVGAHLEDDAQANRKKQQPTILLQVVPREDRSSKMSVSATNYVYYEAALLCPPPSGCKLEQ